MAPTRVPAPLLALLALLILAFPVTADARVPAGWVGVSATDTALLASPSLWTQETRVMRRSGVQTVRIPFYWHQMQPSDGLAAHTNFADTDRIVGIAAQQGLRVLPIVLGTPRWDAKYPSAFGFSVPAKFKPFGDFLGELAKRYGSRGAFWREHPEIKTRPIRIWQAWNEPNLCYYWNTASDPTCRSVKPFAPTYVSLLKAARTGLHAADSHAKLMLAGLPNDSWNALKQVYHAGGRRQFDAVAIHAYSGVLSHITGIVGLDRKVMRQHGDGRLPIYVTEFGWSSAGRRATNGVPWNTSEAGQASRAAAGLRRLAAARRRLGIAGAYWYSWYTPEDSGSTHWEDYTGLRRRGKGGFTVSKPALAAFARAAKRL